MSCMTITSTIRPAKREDLAAIDALLSRSYPALLKRDYPPSVLVTAIPLISRANPALVSSGTYFVVEAGDIILGAGGWTPGAPGGASRPRVGHIRHVVTDHRQIRKGIGRKLMARIVSDAASAGIKQLECFSTRTAEPFYVACGFRTLGPMLVTLRKGIDFPAVHMRRFLESSG
jgi:N-acetylglutamate synthase-like GNAT family acetyltransferase